MGWWMLIFALLLRPFIGTLVRLDYPSGRNTVHIEREACGSTRQEG
jgi:hypothetical protein